MKTNSITENFTNEQMIAIIDFVAASMENEKMEDADWAKGFDRVKQKIDKLNALFAPEDVDFFIMNKAEMAKLFDIH
jgi:uncharacterized protein YpuA (DUF1002 family)